MAQTEVQQLMRLAPMKPTVEIRETVKSTEWVTGTLLSYSPILDLPCVSFLVQVDAAGVAREVRVAEDRIRLSPHAATPR